MATTTNYGITKPTPGGSDGTWGTENNAAIDAFDALLGGDTPVVGIDINSGNVDNTPIGATTPASGKFTSIEATTGSLKLREVNFTGDTVSIADDAVATFNFGTDAGLFEVLVYNAAGSFLAQYSGIGSFTALSGLTATNKWTPSGFSSSSFAVTTGALTGTTGTDGNVTFSVGTSEVYVENRSGSTRTVALILRGNGV